MGTGWTRQGAARGSACGYDRNASDAYHLGGTSFGVSIKEFGDQLGVRRSDLDSFKGLLSEGITVGALQRKDMTKSLSVSTVECVDWAPAVDKVSLHEAIAMAFAGWYWVSDPTKKWPGNGLDAFLSPCSEDLAPYFAPFKTITFKSNGGSEGAPIKKVPGNIISEPEAPTRVGYVFSGEMFYR